MTKPLKIDDIGVLDDQLLKVVVIDDESDLVEMLCELFELHGYKAFGFTDPTKALPEIVKGRHDLILCDMSMPKMTGLDVIKALNKANRSTPVVFISGNLTKDILVEAINQGAEGVIEKPYDEKFVMNICNRVAQRARIRRLFEKSLNLLLYQYSDFDAFLERTAHPQTRKMVENEMKLLIGQRKYLRDLARPKKTS